MTTQINLKFQDDFFELTKSYADSRGYMSVQELVRDALREKIFDDLEVREEYKKVLESKEANTFISEEESEKLHNELKKRLICYKVNRKFRDSNVFKKKINKLKGQELFNVMNKIDEILIITDLNFYKNLKHNFKKIKKVHINNSFVILFLGDNNIVYFIDYEDYDKVYKYNKKDLKRLNNLKFD